MSYYVDIRKAFSSLIFGYDSRGIDEGMQVKQQKRKAESLETEKESTGVAKSLNKTSDEVIKSLWQQLLLGAQKDATTQIMGGESSPKSHGGDIQLHEGKEHSLKKSEKKIEATVEHYRYAERVKNADVTPARQENAMISRQVEEILMELKKIASTTQEAQNLYKQVAVERVPEQAGTYHVHFFEWVLATVRSMRVKVEDAKNWLSVLSSKKKQRQYQSMAKKHGTSFTLSGERTASTQTG